MTEDLKEIYTLIRNGSIEALRAALKECPRGGRSAAGRSVLHAAAAVGNAEAARAILDSGWEEDERSKRRETPLHVAASYGRGLGMLLEDLDFSEGTGQGMRGSPVPAHPEVKAAFWTIFRKLYPGLPTEGDSEGASPELVNASDDAQFELIFAREKLRHEYDALGIDVDALEPEYGHYLRGYPGYLATASLLLDRGADIHARNDYGATPLHLAIELAEAPMVELLLQRGADVHVPRLDEESRYEPPLDYALELSRLDAAKLLHERGAKVNWELWPLHTAAANGRVEILSWLLDIGGDPNQANSLGNTPLMQAAPGHDPAVKLLCERRADVQRRNANGETALHLAGGWLKCVRILLERGAEVDARDGTGRTPLHCAAVGLGDEAIPLLVNAGASVNAQDHEGHTPLHNIFFSDEFRPDIEFPTFEALVAAGADRSLRNREGKTAYDLAVQWHYPEQYLKLLKP